MVKNYKYKSWWGGVGVTLVSLLWTSNALAAWTLNMTKGVTPISHQVYDLHMAIMWVCVVIGIIVFGVMFWSILHHRKSKGAVPAQFHESTTIEIIWTIIPFVILVSMAIPATKTLIAMEDTAHPDMTIRVTGYQWKWKYDYVGQGVSFYSSLASDSEKARMLHSGISPYTVPHYLRDVDHPLVVPIHKKIRFLITGGDVIHSWWVPQLGWKQDAIPGYINENWAYIEKPGTYRGQCAELCGRDHAFMPIVVIAKTETNYEKWLAKEKAAQSGSAASANKTWTKDDLIKKGKDVFDTNCAACHQANGQGIPGSFPPLEAGKVAKLPSNLLDNIRKLGFLTADNKVQMGPVKNHIHIVLHGIKGSPMIAFGPQLSDVDVAAVITYERNSFGNHTGDVVQPSEVKAAR